MDHLSAHQIKKLDTWRGLFSASPCRTALQADEIAAVKEDAEKDLAEAKPALDAALAALNSIAPKDITGLKALKNPPDIVKRIFDCVLFLRRALPLPA